MLMVSTNHIQFKKSPLSSFQFKQTLDSTSTSDVFCTIWGHPRSQRLCNGTPTAARTTCFWKSKPDCSFCVSIWHPALKAGDTLMTISDFLTNKRAAHVFLIFPILKQLRQMSCIPLHDHYLWPNCLQRHFQQNAIQNRLSHIFLRCFKTIP